jgi:hypothetical protein
MAPIDIINKIFTLLSLPTIIGACIYFGRKFQVIDDLKEDMDKVKNNLSTVCNFLIKNNDEFDSSRLKAFSPLNLTEEGYKFISDLGFDKILEENKKDFFNYIASENPKLKYDVEIASIKSLSVLQDKEYMNFLKIYFYNNPEKNYANTAPTLGVYIRDAYLKEHPEITQ